jgi:hypothetical protein
MYVYVHCSTVNTMSLHASIISRRTLLINSYCTVHLSPHYVTFKGRDKRNLHVFRYMRDHHGSHNQNVSL